VPQVNFTAESGATEVLIHEEKIENLVKMSCNMMEQEGIDAFLFYSKRNVKKIFSFQRKAVHDVELTFNTTYINTWQTCYLKHCSVIDRYCRKVHH